MAEKVFVAFFVLLFAGLVIRAVSKAKRKSRRGRGASPDSGDSGPWHGGQSWEADCGAGADTGDAVKIDTTSGVKINNASVVKTDVEASNGVIHVIDTVIMPAS